MRYAVGFKSKFNVSKLHIIIYNYVISFEYWPFCLTHSQSRKTLFLKILLSNDRIILSISYRIRRREFPSKHCKVNLPKTYVATHSAAPWICYGEIIIFRNIKFLQGKQFHSIKLGATQETDEIKIYIDDLWFLLIATACKELFWGL